MDMRFGRPTSSELILLGICLAIGLLTTPTRKPDAVVRERVASALAEDPVIGAQKFEVLFSGGVATVTGQVGDESRVQRALAIVRGTPGALDVIADIRISDEVIRARVLAAFQADSRVRNVPVDVRCVDGEVTLQSSQTNEEQRHRLVQLAAGIDGVTHVVDAMK
jgi:osmotically-inducible protein OsmY